MVLFVLSDIFIHGMFLEVNPNEAIPILIKEILQEIPLQLTIGILSGCDID